MMNMKNAPRTERPKEKMVKGQKTQETRRQYSPLAIPSRVTTKYSNVSGMSRTTT